MVAVSNVLDMSAAGVDKAEIGRATRDGHRMTINGLPKFRFFNGCHEPSSKPLDQTEPIEMSRHDFEYTGRNPGFINKVRKLAERVETELPDNVQVSIAAGPWGGSSAYDNVEIRIFGADGKEAGVDKFYRTIDNFDFPDPALLVPKRIRDNKFMKRILNSARRMAAIYQENPQDPRLNRERPNDGFVGYW